ncbi:MAG: competence protein CoiA family protein [Christensenellaceae bacterium]
MFIAFNDKQEKIPIENATQENQYFCPICGEPLIIKAMNSLAVHPHFAHKRGTKCPDDWHYDMSEWHYSWQQKFPKENREVIITKDGVKHRADVLINNTVIEFQHSPIKGEEIAKRNNFYLTCGYNVVWVFDATDKIKNDIEKSIDPIQCRNDDLCWKRAKQEFTVFATKIPQKVKIFLQYKTLVSNSQYPNQEFDIMILLTKITPKNFTFYSTYPYYILPNNFVKQFGIVINDNTLSISDIVNKHKSLIQQQDNNAKKRYINNLYRTNKPKRNWTL